MGFGALSRDESEAKGWAVSMPTGPETRGFGRDVLQTLGTVNIGGAGNHEKVQVLQARLLGPLYRPFTFHQSIPRKESGGGSGGCIGSSSSGSLLAGGGGRGRGGGEGRGSELCSPREARSSASEKERRAGSFPSTRAGAETRSRALTRGTGSAPSMRRSPLTGAMGPRDLWPWLMVGPRRGM